MYDELKLYNDIDINFIRLTKPLFNSSDLPLSGLYNSIDNIEYQNYPLKNKINNFIIPIGGEPGLENLFQLKNSFDKLLTDEILEGLIILTNISDRDITLKNLEVSLLYENSPKNLGILFPDKENSLLLLQNQSYSIKIKNHLKKSGKYGILVKFGTRCGFYDQQYYLMKQRNKIRENNKYKIIENHVEYYNNKLFDFNVNDPFDIKAIFRMNQMKEEYFIEINIQNKSKYNLSIPDLIIKPKGSNTYLKPISTLQEMKLNNDGIFSLENTNNSSSINSKIFVLQSKEELNILFKSNSKEIFLYEEKFIIYIKWLNIFDFLPKNFEFEFNNELSIFNKYFLFNIIERPKGNIILDLNFPVILQFITKQPKKNFEIIISEYNENNNISKKDREIEIKIKEYKFQLNDKCQKYDVNIICKSDKIGIVKFPKIIIKLIDINENKLLGEYIYKDLLCFNCVENVQLI